MQTLSWTTIDKSTWGDGPWQQEPDKHQWQDEATGLPCLIHRSSGSGALCGYVGVAQAHPLYAHEGDYPDVSVHGGCTYFAFCQPDHAPDGSSGICHLPSEGEPELVRWIGFDCSNSGDWMPARGAAMTSMSELHFTLLGHHCIYRDIAYVADQCRQLALQLRAME